MRSRIAQAILGFILLYGCAALVTYAFRHPEKTETQRFLEIGRALLCR